MRHPRTRHEDRRRPAVSHAAHPRLNAARRGARLMARGVIILLLFLAGILAYLHWIGIPRWASNHWVAAQESRQRFVSAGRMTFNPLEGLVAHDFAYYETEERVLPMLEARRVDVRFLVSEWIRGRPAWQGLRVDGATVRLAPGSSLVRAPPAEILTIHDVGARLSWTPETVVVEAVDGDLLGIRFAGQGRIQLFDEAGSDGPSITEGGGAPSPPEPRSFPWISALIAQLNRVQFSASPEVDITFDIRPRDLMASQLQIHGSGQNTRIRGVAFDRWELRGGFDRGRIQVDQVTLFHMADQLWASLDYELESQHVTGSIACSLPPAHWQSLIPVARREQIEEHGFRFSGPMALSAQWGPCPPSAIWRNLSGSLDARQAELRGVWLDHLAFRFTSTPDSLRLSDIDADVGVGGEYGGLRGTFAWQFEDGRYAGTMQSRLDFAGLAPVLNEGQTVLARSYQIDEHPLSADVRFEGKQGEREAFLVEGTVSGTNIFYRGAHLARGQTRLTVSNRVVMLDDLHVERDEGMIDGFLWLDFEHGVVTLDFTGSMNAKAIGRASGPVVERILRNFEFGAPIRGHVAGAIHTKDRRQTRLAIQAGGDEIAIKAYRSDHLDVDILWTNDLFHVRSFHADLYGGTVTGALDIVLQERGEPALYRVDAVADKLNFEDVVRTMAHREGENYRGQISGTAVLDGVLAAGHGAALTGSGSVKVVKGRIMSIPVFGGLSRGLSKIYPGLGFASQTDFAANFRLRDLKLSSRNVRLEGDLFSLQGKGAYGITEQSLDFDVEFKLLREGNVGTVVRVVTLPLTKLMTFDLEGTLTEPQWRPKNLPREVFELFE